jgi:4-aminobutyrate aminotransferase/(S)-3-amino-2-methylpropionate transaminase
MSHRDLSASAVLTQTVSLRTAVPGPRSLALAERRSRAVARGVPQITPIYAASAHGATITDVDGNIFLDFAGGIGCTNAGHGNEAVLEAMEKQSRAFLHTCFMVSPYEGYVALAERLNELTPGDFEKRTFFVNTGAEAVENAVKIARSYTGRPGVICFDDAYHGRTYMAMALTAKDKPYKAGFGPFPDHVYRVPFANPYRGANATERSMEAIDELFRSGVKPEDIAAVIVEPIQGEGGFIVPPDSFLRGLRALCDRHGIVLIADEVQTGFGRTGKLFACEHFNLVPDILLTAKSMASGMPIAGITGRANIMDQPGPGALGGTFGGNPVSCAAALATLALFEEQDLCARSNEIGRMFSDRAYKWQLRFACIGDVRGVGGMQAIEIVSDRETKAPDTEVTRQIVRFACERGLLLVTAGTFGNVVRLLVPLVASEEQMQEGLDIIEAALESLAGQGGRA